MLRLIPRLPKETPEVLTAAGIPAPLAKVLWARGVQTLQEARAFLQPDLSMLHDPFLLRGMKEAAARIHSAMEAGEAIMVYGDYDVDGVCATAILVEALRARQAKVDFYIPSRHKEGYGLNCDAVGEIAQRASLLITVDCGITSVEEAALCRSLGLDLIITDHHEPPEALPDALEIINPLLGAYPFRRLCGAGVALKLAQALFGLEATEPLIELAALATVADMVPLLGENRVLVHHGLALLQHTSRPGLRALMTVSGLEKKTVTAGHLGFQIGPRINAGGRLSDAARNVRLLLTRDEALAREMAQALDEENAARQRMEQQILREAEAAVRAEMDFLREKVILVVGQGWNTGVVGLVASRLVEKFAWPTVVLSESDGVCTGSARSIPGVNMHTALTRCADLFQRFGGHAQAAGMTLSSENVPALRRRLSGAIAEIAEPDAFVPSAAYDLPITLEEVTIPLIEQMERLAPTGFGNPAPVFLLSDAQVLEARGVGVEGKHLKLRLGQEGMAAEGIAFGQGNLRAMLPDRVDALFSPTVNEFMGRRSAQCEIARILPHAPLSSFREECLRRAHDFDFHLLALPPPERASLPSAALASLAAEALRKTPQGTLLTVSTLEGALYWLSYLQEQGLADRLDFCFHTPEDPRRFNAFCAMPGPEAGEGFDRTLCLDGALVPAAAAAFVPSDEALRDLYRMLRAANGRFPSEETLSEAAGLKPAAVRLGLVAFDELSLIAYTRAPFRALLLEPKRCSLTDSPALARAREMTTWEVEG